MPTLQLSLENIVQFKGGMVALMVDKALNRIATDIESAPDILEFREVILKIRAKPFLDRGELDHVITEFVVSPRMPHRVTSGNLLVRSDAQGARQLFFNLDAADASFQTTISDIPKEVKKP